MNEIKFYCCLEQVCDFSGSSTAVKKNLPMISNFCSSCTRVQVLGLLLLEGLVVLLDVFLNFT
jgi:hypothetical protein